MSWTAADQYRSWRDSGYDTPEEDYPDEARPGQSYKELHTGWPISGSGAYRLGKRMPNRGRKGGRKGVSITRKRRVIDVKVRTGAAQPKRRRARAPRKAASGGFIGPLRKNEVKKGSFWSSAMRTVGALGHAAISGLITGHGDYRVSSNSLLGGGPPVFDENGTVTIAHREFLQDVSGSTTFTLQNFLINPGLFATFPWLSALAANFEQYDLLGLVFEFKSTSASALNSTNTALGVVVASTNYDTLDANFTSKQQMEAYQYTTSCAPCESMIHAIECAPRLSALSNQYIRVGAVPSGGDQRFYDVGNFQLMTTGMQAAAVIGELWVSYHVRLIKPKLPTPLGAQLLGAHYTGTATTANAYTAATQRSGSNMTLVFTALSFTLPNVGRYLVGYRAKAATSITFTGGFTPAAGIVSVDWFTTESSSNAIVAGDTTALAYFGEVFDVTVPGAALTFASPTIVGATTWDLTVVQISAGMTIPQVMSVVERLAKLEALCAGRLLVDEDEFKSESPVHVSVNRLSRGLLPRGTNCDTYEDVRRAK